MCVKEKRLWVVGHKDLVEVKKNEFCGKKIHNVVQYYERRYVAVF